MNWRTHQITPIRSINLVRRRKPHMFRFKGKWVCGFPRIQLLYPTLRGREHVIPLIGHTAMTYEWCTMIDHQDPALAYLDCVGAMQ